jgi:hypothetical protein
MQLMLYLLVLLCLLAFPYLLYAASAGALELRDVYCSCCCTYLLLLYLLAFTNLLYLASAGALELCDVYCSCCCTYLLLLYLLAFTYLLYLASAGALELRDVYSAKNLMQFLEFSKELGWQVCSGSGQVY